MKPIIQGLHLIFWTFQSDIGMSHPFFIAVIMGLIYLFAFRRVQKISKELSSRELRRFFVCSSKEN
jgi:multisubunit Na+/H+ antiporter MnhE subunit